MAAKGSCGSAGATESGLPTEVLSRCVSHWLVSGWEAQIQNGWLSRPVAWSLFYSDSHYRLESATIWRCPTRTLGTQQYALCPSHWKRQCRGWENGALQRERVSQPHMAMLSTPISSFLHPSVLLPWTVCKLRQGIHKNTSLQLSLLPPFLSVSLSLSFSLVGIL